MRRLMDMPKDEPALAATQLPARFGGINCDGPLVCGQGVVIQLGLT